MDPSIGVFALLPGVAATLVAMHRVRRTSFMTAHPPLARAALVALAVLLFGACHSIDRDAFAHAPVPLSTLPFREPLAYSLGAQSGTVVPFQPGLLASYYAGAQYDRLDHQQVDPNVDFTWDATGNPVISAPDGIDHNDGDFRLPDSWGIWSVVWEGYLKVPSDGTYLLRIHVNNGGWLEMKTPSGALTTVIDCAGGTSFEGDCDATTTLAAGPQYIRFSYYNNAPPDAVARLLWQPPGATAVAVVSSDVLTTQPRELSQRSVLFVHGIRGNADDSDTFKILLDPLHSFLPQKGQVRNFRYYQDVGDLDAQQICHTTPFTAPANTAGLPLNLSAHSLDLSICDSQSNVGINAVRLDKNVRDLHDQFGGPVTIIANSMGGAIVRAFLAYAVDANTGAANPGVVSDVFFLQGAQEGSYIAYSKVLLLGLQAQFGPAQDIVFQGIAGAVEGATGYDATRPAIDDLLPMFSTTYNYVNPRPVHVPDHIRYFNVASDIRWQVRIDIAGTGFLVPVRYSIEDSTGSLGDYVMLQGDDDPTSLPLLGGERFLPSTIGRGRLSQQWILRHDLTTEMSATIAYIPTAPFVSVNYSFPNDPLHVPESHLELGAKMDLIMVTDRVTGETVPLNIAILREIERQGQ